jgi:hypothetical protein
MEDEQPNSAVCWVENKFVAEKALAVLPSIHRFVVKQLRVKKPICSTIVKVTKMLQNA